MNETPYIPVHIFEFSSCLADSRPVPYRTRHAEWPQNSFSKKIPTRAMWVFISIEVDFTLLFCVIIKALACRFTIGGIWGYRPQSPSDQPKFGVNGLALLNQCGRLFFSISVNLVIRNYELVYIYIYTPNGIRISPSVTFGSSIWP